MFGRKKDDNKIDVASVNELIRTSKNVVNILFILLIGCLIFLVGHLLINWGILASIKTLIKIMAPLFIGFIIAWLLDPLVDFLQTKGSTNKRPTSSLIKIPFNTSPFDKSFDLHHSSLSINTGLGDFNLPFSYPHFLCPVQNE